MSSKCSLASSIIYFRTLHSTNPTGRDIIEWRNAIGSYWITKNTQCALIRARLSDPVWWCWSLVGSSWENNIINSLMKGFSKAISLGITGIHTAKDRPRVHMQPIRLASLAGWLALEQVMVGRMIESEDLSQSLFYCISVAE